jgi:membrane protein insertase Oxa1/YidC/SpoIIIJ
LAFGFIFFKLAAGLVLYYLTANIVGIAQQVLINRLMPIGPPASPASGGTRPAQKKPLAVNSRA